MAKQYRFRFEGTAEELIAKVRSECVGHGVRFQGDTSEGSVKYLGLNASYRVDRDTMNVTVKSIPIFLTFGRLEREMARFTPDYRATVIE